MEAFSYTFSDSEDEPIAFVQKCGPYYTADTSSGCPGSSSAEPGDPVVLSKSTDPSPGRNKRAKSVDHSVELGKPVNSVSKRTKQRRAQVQKERIGNDIVACFKQRAEKKTETEKQSTAVAAATSSVGSPNTDK